MSADPVPRWFVLIRNPPELRHPDEQPWAVVAAVEDEAEGREWYKKMTYAHRALVRGEVVTEDGREA